MSDTDRNPDDPSPSDEPTSPPDVPPYADPDIPPPDPTAIDEFNQSIVSPITPSEPARVGPGSPTTSEFHSIDADYADPLDEGPPHFPIVPDDITEQHPTPEEHRRHVNALLAMAAQRARRRRRLLLLHGPTTRELVLFWCLWLLGSWAVTLWVDATAPALRWMTFASAFGLMVVWPLVRLSQHARRPRHRPRPARRRHTARFGGATPPWAWRGLSPWLVFRDWVCLNLVFQAVIWPLRATGQWEVAQAAWLDAAFVGWSLLTALVIAWGVRSRQPSHRAAAMAICMLILLGEPVVQIVASLGAQADLWPNVAWRLRVSPIQTLWELAGEDDPVNWAGLPWSPAIISVIIAAAAGWAVLVVVQRVSNAPQQTPAMRTMTP